MFFLRLLSTTNIFVTCQKVTCQSQEEVEGQAVAGYIKTFPQINLFLNNVYLNNQGKFFFKISIIKIEESFKML